MTYLDAIFEYTFKYLIRNNELQTVSCCSFQFWSESFRHHQLASFFSIKASSHFIIYPRDTFGDTINIFDNNTDTKEIMNLFNSWKQQIKAKSSSLSSSSSAAKRSMAKLPYDYVREICFHIVAVHLRMHLFSGSKTCSKKESLEERKGNWSLIRE